jgi:hypothetical protein
MNQIFNFNQNNIDFSQSSIVEKVKNSFLSAKKLFIFYVIVGMIFVFFLSLFLSLNRYLNKYFRLFNDKIIINFSILYLLSCFLSNLRYQSFWQRRVLKFLRSKSKFKWIDYPSISERSWENKGEFRCCRVYSLKLRE